MVGRKTQSNEQQSAFKVKENQFSGLCQDYRIWLKGKEGSATTSCGRFLSNRSE
jgi:hypothetical protein